MSFFVNDTATTEIYTLSLHDALPISPPDALRVVTLGPTAAYLPEASDGSITNLVRWTVVAYALTLLPGGAEGGTPEATPNEIGRAQSELQSRQYPVCRLLLEKKIYHN